VSNEAIITAIIVLAAASYLLRYLWRSARGKATGCGCGDEGGCPKAKTPPTATP
jgi:hypothetical protein